MIRSLTKAPQDSSNTSSSSSVALWLHLNEKSESRKRYYLCSSVPPMYLRLRNPTPRVLKDEYNFKIFCDPSQVFESKLSQPRNEASKAYSWQTGRSEAGNECGVG